MNHLQTTGKMKQRRKSAPVETSFFELLQELSRLTDDDDLVIAVVKKIFTSHRVMAGDSPVPVRLALRDRPCNR